MALLESELRDYLITTLAEVVSNNITFGLMPTESTIAPVKIATIYANGGETEGIFRFRVMTRGETHTEAMTYALAIYEELQRLNKQALTSYRVYMITGQRPQQSGRTETGKFLTSSDYRMEFTEL